MDEQNAFVEISLDYRDEIIFTLTCSFNAFLRSNLKGKPFEETKKLIELNNQAVCRLLECPLLQTVEKKLLCLIPNVHRDFLVSRLTSFSFFIGLLGSLPPDLKELNGKIQKLLKILFEVELGVSEKGQKRLLSDDSLDDRSPAKKKIKTNSASVKVHVAPVILEKNVEIAIDDFLAKKGNRIKSFFPKHKSFQFIVCFESIGYSSAQADKGGKEISVLLACVGPEKTNWTCKFRSEFLVKSSVENVKSVYSQVEDVFSPEKDCLLVKQFLTRTKIMSVCKNEPEKKKYLTNGVLCIQIKITIIETILM